MDGCVKPGRTGFPATIQGVFRSKLGRHCCIGRRAIRFWTFIPRRDSEHRAALRGASHGEHSCPAGSQWLQWEPKVVKTYGGSAVLVLDLEAAMPEREFIQSPTPAWSRNRHPAVNWSARFRSCHLQLRRSVGCNPNIFRSLAHLVSKQKIESGLVRRQQSGKALRRCGDCAACGTAAKVVGREV